MFQRDGSSVVSTPGVTRPRRSSVQCPPAGVPRTERQTVTLLIPTLNEMVDAHEQGHRVIFVSSGAIAAGLAPLGFTRRPVTIPDLQACAAVGQSLLMQAYNEILPLIRGDVVLTFSPDGNSIPELIPQLVDKINQGYDMVIASRYLGSAKSEDDDLLTAFGNWLFTKTVNWLNGAHYTDVMVIYRAYKKQLVYDLELVGDRWHATPERLFGCRISWEPLLSARAARRKLRLAEIPGDEPPRIGGERKLRIWRWGASYYYQFWRDALLCR